MARRYYVPFSVACAAATELASIKTAASKFARALGFTLNDADAGASLPVSQQLAVQAQLFTGSLGGASGGSAATALPYDPGESAATSVARTGDTALTTGTVTAGQGYLGGCYITQGLAVTFPEPIPILPGERFALQLTAAPSGTVTLAGQLILEEMGG